MPWISKISKIPARLNKEEHWKYNYSKLYIYNIYIHFKWRRVLTSGYSGDISHPGWLSTCVTHWQGSGPSASWVCIVSQQTARGRWGQRMALLGHPLCPGWLHVPNPRSLLLIDSPPDSLLFRPRDGNSFATSFTLVHCLLTSLYSHLAIESLGNKIK